MWIAIYKEQTATRRKIATETASSNLSTSAHLTGAKRWTTLQDMHQEMKHSLLVVVCMMAALTFFHSSGVGACEVTLLQMNASNYQGHCWELVDVPVCSGGCKTSQVSISSSIDCNPCIILPWRMMDATAVVVCNFLWYVMWYAADETALGLSGRYSCCLLWAVTDSAALLWGCHTFCNLLLTLNISVSLPSSSLDISCYLLAVGCDTFQPNMFLFIIVIIYIFFILDAGIWWNIVKLHVSLRFAWTYEYTSDAMRAGLPTRDLPNYSSHCVPLRRMWPNQRDLFHCLTALNDNKIISIHWLYTFSYRPCKLLFPLTLQEI